MVIGQTDPLSVIYRRILGIVGIDGQSNMGNDTGKQALIVALFISGSGIGADKDKVF